MKRIAWSLLIVAGVGFSRLGFADVVTNYWQATDQGLDGSWGDTDHWSLGHLPTDGEVAVIDPLRTGGSSADFTITVDEAYTADSLTIGDPDNATRRQAVRFAGTGSLEFSQKSQGQFIIRNCLLGIVFDGPDFTVHGSTGVLNYSVLTVRNGSSLYCDGTFTSWKGNDNLVVDDGGSVSVKSFSFYNGGNGRSAVVRAGGSFICRDSFAPHSSSETDRYAKEYAFDLRIEGGSAQIKSLRLTRAAASLKMSAGTLRLTEVPELAADDLSQIQVTGGEMIWGFDVTQSADDPWYQYMMAHPDVVCGCNKLQMDQGTLFRHSGTFHVSQFKNLSTTASMQVDCDRLVFDGNNWPFTWNGSGTRITHLYGPTEIRVDGRDFNQAYQNCYLYCHGKIVVDLRDWSSPDIVRTMKFRGFHSADGTLEMTVRGKGGSFTIGPAYSYESFSSFAVEEGVALSLGNRSTLAEVGKATEWGPLSAESLTFGKDVTVSLTAGLQHICASRWSIDPTVRISVSLPDATLTHGAFPILVDLDSKDLPASLLGQIELVGSPEGWALENAHGQISVYRRDSTLVGKFGGWEWTGAAGDGKWSSAGNWQGGTSPSERLTHVFGASDKTGIDHNGTSSGGTTVGSIVFQTNAVMSYTISNKQMTYNNGNAITSYSWVPQCLKTGLRMTNGDRKIYANFVGPILLGAGQAMELKSGGTGAYECYGDIRLGCTTKQYVQSLRMAKNNRAFPSFRTAMTVVSGGDIKFNKQTAALNQAGSTLRVSKGGSLQFTAGDGLFYQWTQVPASIVVDGTLNIAAPFRGGANQNYRGSGRLNIAGGTVSHTASSVVSFGEKLQVYPTTWSTVTPGAENLAIAMGANSGMPVIHVTDGWTYGPAAGVTPTASANSRAFVLANGAVATIEANGGSVRFVEGVRGFGTLAISNGTLTVEGACSGDQSVLAACAGATLKLVGDQTLGGLSAGPTAAVELDGEMTLGGELDLAGASLKISPTTIVTAAKGVKLGDTALDLGSATITRWRTLFTAGNGAITGLPEAGDSYKFRTVETENGFELQCKSVTGVAIIVK